MEPPDPRFLMAVDLTLIQMLIPRSNRHRHNTHKGNSSSSRSSSSSSPNTNISVSSPRISSTSSSNTDHLSRTNMSSILTFTTPG